MNILPRPVKDLGEMMHVVFIPTAKTVCPKPTMIPRVTNVSKKNCLEGLAWLKENNPRYEGISVARDFLNEETYSIPIDETVPTDDLNRFHPSHAESLLNKITPTNEKEGMFHPAEEQIRTEQKGRYEIEEITRCCLYTSKLNERTPDKIAITGSVNTWLKHTPNGITSVVHQNNSLEFQNNMEWIIDCYPTLFPEGLTGPCAKRPRPVTLDQWIKYWLEVYDDRYAKHYDFIFVLYNLTQRKKVLDLTR